MVDRPPAPSPGPGPDGSPGSGRTVRAPGGSVLEAGGADRVLTDLAGRLDEDKARLAAGDEHERPEAVLGVRGVARRHAVAEVAHRGRRARGGRRAGDRKRERRDARNE